MLCKTRESIFSERESFTQVYKQGVLAAYSRRLARESFRLARRGAQDCVLARNIEVRAPSAIYAQLTQNKPTNFISLSLSLSLIYYINLSQVNFEHDLINQLNNHYNKNRHIEVSERRDLLSTN